MTATSTEFQDYLRGEWLLFAGDQTRQQAMRDAVKHVPVHRVLDVGCGGGQDLIPFAAMGAACIGIDIAVESGQFAKTLFSTHCPGRPVGFAASAAERLPFTDSSFDVVLCRVAIPYTNNRAAIGEMARVLRPGGVLLLKTHHPAYYVQKALDGVRQRSPLFALHALRVLVTGAIYHLSGWQPHGGILLRETFQTQWLLRRELERHGLRIVDELPDTHPLTPSYRIVKRAS
jgi:ubiquinone/menaquinone biosynthesis C-methylase UbiE